MLFDKVEQSDDFDQLWPLKGNGKIIVTTQETDTWAQINRARNCNQPIYTIRTGQVRIVILTSWPGELSSDPASEGELNEELGVGGLPLGVAHITATMCAQRSSVMNFLRDYRRNKLRYHI